jgi:hypothetical protein
VKLSLAEQRCAIVADLLRDAECSERQAITGPFFPGVTAENLRAYAARCRALAGASHWDVKQFISGEAWK